MRRVLALGVTLSVLGAVGACTRKEPARDERTPVRVAAASDLTLAFEELGRSFESRTGRPVVFSFGSTGLLAKQLREGAPFDVFAAANVSFVDEVVRSGACDGATKTPYARGRIAVWTKRGQVAPAAKLSELSDRRFVRIAIANPEHAPYGQAARQAFERAGVYPALKSRLLFGENVRQAFQFAESGNADAAIVALSLVIGDHENPWLLIDDGLHEPIDQALTVCNRGRSRDGGGAFARFVGSDEGRRVMRKYGFLLPGEKLVRGP